MEALEELKQQEHGFAYLASVFLALPDEDLVRRIRAFDHNATADDGAAAQLMRSYAGSIADKSDADAAVELGVDRAKLLRHVDASCIAPPYESLYVSESEDTVLQKINRFLDEHSFAPSPDMHEANDYLGMELSFMQFTLAEQAHAVEAGDDERARSMNEARTLFWNEHLGKWVALYGAEMRRAAATDYYRAIAELLCALG